MALFPSGSERRYRNLSLRRHTTFPDCSGGRSCTKGECIDCIQQLVPPQARGLACRGCASVLLRRDSKACSADACDGEIQLEAPPRRIAAARL